MINGGAEAGKPRCRSDELAGLPNMLNGSEKESVGSNKVGNEAALPIAGGRVASVDALRGLTILLMVFVNDLGLGAPAWVHHIQPSNADGMTLADVVFPLRR
jgi:hypothetical protein